MLASQFGTRLASINMVDDSMEISSENGHNAGEDIDIDIDLTSGQVDEDYVLEDAASTTGFGESFRAQPSPLTANDDLMIDDGDEYPMADAELMQDDGEQNVEHEAAAMSFSGADPSQFAEEEHVDKSHLTADLHNGAGLIWEVEDVQVEEVDDNDIPNENPEATITHGEEEPLDDPDTKEAEEPAEPTSGLSDEHFEILIPRNPNPSHITTDEQHRNASSPFQEKSPPDRTNDHSTTISNANSVVGDIEEPVELTLIDHAKASRSAHEVIVVYQSIEYRLFSKSESDDPDSFFLSDQSIAEKPLDDFFKHIREVIHDDLADEEELCMSIEDLGLEIEEISPLCLEVTFGQMMSLHEKLLQNDSVESPRPLYVILGTRPNFSKRLSNLSAGVAEGKGLSELVTWDEQSESLLEPADIAEGKQGDELENYEEEEEYDNAAGRVDDEKSEENKDEPSVDPTNEHGPLVESGDVKQSAAPVSPTGIPETLVPQETRISDAQPLETTKAVGEYDEDGDLIDYSDEELDNSNKQQRGELHLVDLDTDAGRTHNEYEVINEELRRRSISRAAEVSAIPQDVENDHDDRFSRLQAETDIGYGEDENNVENFEPHLEEAEHEASYADDGENFDASTETERQEDNLFDLGADGTFGGDDLSSESKNGAVVEEDTYGSGNGNSVFENETEFGIDDDIQAENLPELSETKLGSKEATLSSGLGFTDAAESSATANTDEIKYELLDNQKVSDTGKIVGPQTSNGIAENKGYEDEIGYEDDEEQDSLEAQGTLQESKELTVANGGPWKRQRAEDADVDDSMNTRSKDAKRRRS